MLVHSWVQLWMLHEMEWVEFVKTVSTNLSIDSKAGETSGL
jgi:hypothetical protein